MQQPTGRGAARPPIGIAFDGDAGNRIDALLAIAMLNGMTAKTQARRISLSVSRPSLVSAQVADVVAAFYRGQPVAGPGGGIGQASEGMIGMPESETVSADVPPFAAILASKGRTGRRHTSSITGLVNTAESSVLIRIWFAQHDGNAAIVLAGPATGLVRSSTCIDPVRRSRRSAGSSSWPRARFRRSRRAEHQERHRGCPPAVHRMADADRGWWAPKWRRALASRGEHRERFAWSLAHPVVEAYRASADAA
jgi:hypothetical protein